MFTLILVALINVTLIANGWQNDNDLSLLASLMLIVLFWGPGFQQHSKGLRPQALALFPP